MRKFVEKPREVSAALMIFGLAWSILLMLLTFARVAA